MSIAISNSIGAFLPRRVTNHAIPTTEDQLAIQKRKRRQFNLLWTLQVEFKQAILRKCDYLSTEIIQFYYFIFHSHAIVIIQLLNSLKAADVRGHSTIAFPFSSNK